MSEFKPKKIEPKGCKVCGRLPSETKFYPSRSDRCAECIKAANTKNKELLFRVEPPPGGPSGPEPPANDPLGEIDQYADPFSDQQTAAVPEMAAADVPRRIVIDLRDDPQILEALKKVARCERRTLEMQAIVILERGLSQER